MHTNYYFSPLIVAVAISFTPTLKAAKPVPLQKIPFSTLQKNYQILDSTIKLNASTNPSPNTLKFLSDHTDRNHVNHIRMEQHYLGFPVYGGYAVLHSKQTFNTLLKSKSAPTTMNGQVYQDLQQELGQPRPDYISKAQQALDQFKAPYLQEKITEETVTPIIYVNKQHQAFWAYRVSLYVQYNDKIPARPTAILNAETLQPFVQWDEVKNFSKVKGIGYGGNQSTGKYQYGKDLPELNILRDDDTGVCYMRNSEVTVVDMHHNPFYPNLPMRFHCQQDDNNPSKTYWTGYHNDGFDRINGAYSPTNDALYAGQVIKHLYLDWYNLDVLVKNNHPAPLIMRVHYGFEYENAFWDGKEMTFGDGGPYIHPLVSVGIGAHEVSHGFTSQHSGLEGYGQAGGINESFSDMAAQAAEYYVSGKNNWQIGSEIMKKFDGVGTNLRYMDKPSRDGRSIDKATDYDDYLDVHESCGVYNRLFYLLSTLPDWEPRKAFNVMIKANMDYWTPFTSFDEGGCGIISAANDLGYNVDEVKGVLQEVAINYSQCENNA